jgi:hypothetical protein
MKALRIIVLLAVVVTGCGKFTEGKATGERAIAHFHDLYNQGKIDDIWSEADSQFRNASPKMKYEEFMGAVQRKLGKVTSCSNVTWRVQSFNMKTSVLMKQQTVFENGKGTESFNFGLDGTNAVLLGYNLQSMDLITK